MTRQVLLAGAGEMAVHHHRVLKALGAEPIVIGRGAASADKFAKETGAAVASRDLATYLKSNGCPADVVVSVGVEALAPVTLELIRAGARNILLEKPGALTFAQLQSVAEAGRAASAKVWLAYNRRFYGSVRLAREYIAKDGGITSCHFDFTEWSHQIAALERPPEVKARWLLANSSHVIDLVFHLMGTPSELYCVTSGSLPWHPASSQFAGHGRGASGAPFSYHANWAGPGRWMCEFVTANHKLLFQPMEELRLMVKGSVAINKVDAPDDLDATYKPGLYLQARAFLAGGGDGLCTLAEQLSHWRFYERIANYSS